MGTVPKIEYGRRKTTSDMWFLHPACETSLLHILPCLPSIEMSGWIVEQGIYIPERCILLPAPSCVMDLVKCTCKGLCDPDKNLCSCTKNGFNCTPFYYVNVWIVLTWVTINSIWTKTKIKEVL